MARTARLNHNRLIDSEGMESSLATAHMPRQRRRTPNRRRKTGEDLAAAMSPTIDFDTSQIKSLLADYAPEDAEPADLERSADIPPVEQRLRARSAHPPVTSVPEDIHSSVLQPGGKTALLTPCQEIILARRI